MTKHFRPFFISVFFSSAVGRVCFKGWIVRTAVKRLVIGFGVVISKLEYYTIIFCINVYLNGKYRQYIINDYLERILKCEI